MAAEKVAVDAEGGVSLAVAATATVAVGEIVAIVVVLWSVED